MARPFRIGCSPNRATSAFKAGITALPTACLHARNFFSLPLADYFPLPRFHSRCGNDAEAPFTATAVAWRDPHHDLHIAPLPGQKAHEAVGGKAGKLAAQETRYLRLLNPQDAGPSDLRQPPVPEGAPRPA